MRRIAYLCDIHYDPEEPEPNGVPVWKHFDRVLESALSRGAQLLVLGGDLALNVGKSESYAAIADRLAGIPCDYIVQPGNHDDRDLFADAFGRRYRSVDSEPLDRFVQWDGLNFLFLDSSDRSITDRSLRWCESIASDHTINALFIHHPVITGMHRYMDANYPLENARQVREFFALTLPGIPVFSGHYHTAYEFRDETIHQFITPAVYFQIDPVSETFAIESTKFAYRLIDFTDDGSIAETDVIFPAG